MKTKIYFILLVASLLVFQVGCTSKTANTTKNNEKPKTNQEVKAPELLYGKYPEPILKAIADNNDVKKDYKEITKEDLSRIKNLSFEKKHGFEDNKEYDFSILKEIGNLESLSFYNISFTNISILENLTQLKQLNLDGCKQLKDFQALKYLKNINLINLSNMNITEKELSTFPDLSSLKSLGLVGNSLTSIIDFPELINLESLTLDENPLESIKIPENCLPRIQNLGISKTLISDANEISGLDTIKHIYMYNTKITKLAPFKKYKNLESINTKLTSIEDKEELENTNILLIED